MKGVMSPIFPTPYKREEAVRERARNVRALKQAPHSLFRKGAYYILKHVSSNIFKIFQDGGSEK